MGLFSGLSNQRWTHKCGGRATPGERCDHCDAKLKASADATWDRPNGWTPPGEATDAGRSFSW